MSARTSAASDAAASRSSGPYPGAFVATAVSGNGIAMYSSADGSMVRRLTTADRDGAPFYAGSRQWVYFTRPGPSGSCRYGLWRVPSMGGPAQRVAVVDGPASAVALSPGGRLLAYATSRDPCNLKLGDDRVVLQDLATGQQHTIEVTGGAGEGPSLLAWSPGGGTLAIVAPVGLTGADRIHLAHDPFRLRTTSNAALVPCPNTQACAQMAPSYSADGHLFYLAQTGSRSCWFTACPMMNYDVIRYDRSRSSVLVSQRARPGLLVRGTVNAATSAVIFAIPNRSGRTSVWRWSGGTLFKIPAPGGQATDPAW